MKFTAYSPITGQVLFRGEASDPTALKSDSVAVLVGHKYEEDGWIADDEFHPLPKQPSPHHVFDYSAKAWTDPRTPETQWPVVRRQRDALLAQSDWTQLPDVPLETKETWATYRQALRDVTLQPDPFNVVWPVTPD